MKAQEFCIDNLVYTFKDDKRVVSKITGYNLYTWQLNKKQWTKIETIELTEEWLIKSKYTEELKEWKGNGQDYQPETSKTKQRRFYLKEDIYLVFTYFSYRANEKDKWITDKSISIEYYGDSIQLTKYYIHTFQNLFFALTGNELEIK